MHYNGGNSYLFVNGTGIIKFKAKDSETVANSLNLGNSSKDFSVDNMKKTELYGQVYDFSADYDAIPVDDILDIQKYLMKKNGISAIFFGCNILNVNPLKCVSMNNQECRIRPE